MTRIATRTIPPRAAWALEQTGLHPLLARLYAARGILNPEQIDMSMGALLPPKQLKGAAEAAVVLADALAAGQKILIVADYDCDGATACAVGVRALRALGGTVDYLVPDRFKLGYGLSVEVAELVTELTAARRPDLVVTVDNGIASVAGIAHLAAHGIRTVITDHHLPGEELPAAAAIVNPNQPGCRFPSKALAGVGAMFYVALALRAELRQRGAFAQKPEPNLASLLDLVSLGTVADVVALDQNNRILVSQGLTRIRSGKMHAGIAALLAVAGREAAAATTFDLGFAIGPRLNAAGRLTDMSIGIECLITDDPARALNLAQELDSINRERRTIEATMRDEAEELLADLDAENRASLTLFDPEWHQGVVGLVAGRIKEKLHRPTFAFARSGEENDSAATAPLLKASGRSIPGLHLRDALDLVAKRHPGLLLRFGGHAAAAGLTLEEDRLSEFEDAFEQVCREILSPAQLTRQIETDGPLETGYFSLDTVRLLQREIWGQAFPPPLFADTFQVLSQRLLKDKHLKLKLKKGQQQFDAIQFNFADSAPDRIYAAFKVDINEWNGRQDIQLLLEHFEPA